MLPKGAYVINVARGGHLKEPDLIPAIDSGQLAGATLDVFETEPLPEKSPFWQHPKIIVTPHVAAISDPAGRELLAFFVRKEKKQHGLQRWVEGPLLAPGTRVLIVEDVVTTGGSTVQAIERCREEGLEIAGTVAVLDRLAGGGDAIAAASGGAPYVALATIDDVHPERDDRA